MEVEEIILNEKYIEVRYNPIFEILFNNTNALFNMDMFVPSIREEMETHLFTFRFISGVVGDKNTYELHTTDFNLPILEAYLAKNNMAGAQYSVRCMFTSTYPNFKDEAGNTYNIPTKFVMDIVDTNGRMKKIHNITK